MFFVHCVQFYYLLFYDNMVLKQEFIYRIEIQVFFAKTFQTALIYNGIHYLFFACKRLQPFFLSAVFESTAVCDTIQ